MAGKHAFQANAMHAHVCINTGFVWSMANLGLSKAFSF